MSVRSRKSRRVRREAMPVETSIPWKPLRDSHYIVAGLQPGGGGLRQIFARQSTLREIQALARGDSELPVVGLLLGEQLECTVTFTPYVLIASHVEVAVAAPDERGFAEAIRTLRARVDQRNAVDVLGWYCSNRDSANAEVSRAHAAVHASCFEERWQTLLILGDGGNAGAFFLHDSTAGRWFQAPFFEITDSTARSPSPRRTCIEWSTYLTTASVVPMAEVPQPMAVPSRQRLVAAQTSAPRRRQPGVLSQLIVTVRRTPAKAMVSVKGAAGAARRSALDVALLLFDRAVSTSRFVHERIARMHSARVARAAQRKAEADAAREREAKRRAKEAAERRAAREEAQRRAAEAERQHAAEAEARRIAEAEARRAAEAEAQRVAAEQARVRAAEEEARRVAEEAERKAAEEEQRRLAEAEAQRRAREAEEEARRKAAEAEEEARHRAAELEALRVSLVVAATRSKLARPPVEGSRRDTSRAAGAQMADHDDTTASDSPDRYLALAMREGFEMSVQLERGSPEDPETLSLLYESESGFRLIVFSTDDTVRAASLHYNLRTEDDSLLERTSPEHRDLASRTIYVREACVTGLRARCRHLRATGMLERDWKVSPALQDR